MTTFEHIIIEQDEDGSTDIRAKVWPDLPGDHIRVDRYDPANAAQRTLADALAAGSEAVASYLEEEAAVLEAALVTYRKMIAELKVVQSESGAEEAAEAG